jgi:hypothetical protein
MLASPNADLDSESPQNLLRLFSFLTWDVYFWSIQLHVKAYYVYKKFVIVIYVIQSKT